MCYDIRDIWTLVIDGDREAWETLVRRFAPLVMTVARNAGLTPQDAEDCAQQTWLTLYRNRLGIKDPTRLPAWLIRTTHRRAVRASQRVVRDARLDPDLQSPRRVSLPDEEVLELERQAMLELALEQLDPRCARLLHSLFFSDEGKSYREIAREIGITPNSLGPLRSRCLKRLGIILEKLGYPLN